MNLSDLICELLNYAVECGLCESDDEAFCACSLLSIFGENTYSPSGESKEKRALHLILEDLLAVGAERGLCDDGVVSRDLLDTKIMGVFLPRPSDFNKKFEQLYKADPASATNWFYKSCCDSNYIRRDRIAKDVRFNTESEYGEIEISINLSKPEKDPKAIAAAKLLPQSDFPKCLLCHENEGFAGDLSKPARQNLRQIPFEMAGDLWYLQYSPYVYYNEHCIALCSRHEPMSINPKTFDKLLSFVEHFPHYFIGSNADLPIVGGSILSHDHMQGGRHTFPMERASVKKEIAFKGYEDIKAGIVRWPMSVIRLCGKDKDRLSSLASRILSAWREYTDRDAMILASTDGEPHNTITPIARRADDEYTLDLVLRNNLTTEEHPLGLYHPHAEHHNIKKENIGLIEVMGLAVLPARLKKELASLADAAVSGEDFCGDPEIGKHFAWFECFKKDYTFTKDNAEGIIRAEVGKTFVRVLSDAGVYKDTEKGLADFEKFIGFVNNN